MDALKFHQEKLRMFNTDDIASNSFAIHTKNIEEEISFVEK